MSETQPTGTAGPVDPVTGETPRQMADRRARERAAFEELRDLTADQDDPPANSGR